MEAKWYTVRVLSGHEKKIKTAIESEVELAGIAEKVLEVVVPAERIIEMKDGKKTLTESIEKKVTASVAPSSKKLDEAKEVTAYANDEHIQKMKRLIEYVEKRGSKKII